LAIFLVIAKWTYYAASACWGYASGADRQRLEAVLRRAKPTGLCSKDELTLAEIAHRAEDDLFQKIFIDPHDTLRNILPDEIVPY